VLIGLGAIFWDFPRAFLQKPFLPIGGWLSAAGAIAILIALDTGLVAVLPLSRTIGAFTLTERMLTTPFLGPRVAVVYTSIAVVTVLAEYIRRPSPLHRNRIKFWLLGTAALVAGLVLVWTRQVEDLIQIDEIKRAQEVEAVTGSDYFRQLQAEARRIRRGRATGGEGGEMFDRLQRELKKRSKVEGITPADVMDLPEPLRTAMNKMMRRGSMTLSELAAELKLETAETRRLGQMLVENGFLSSLEREADGEIIYQTRFARKRGVPLDVWKALDD
jgi:hypothetical protein